MEERSDHYYYYFNAQQQQQQQQYIHSTRRRGTAAGEGVGVEGGGGQQGAHIVRPAAGRKDRHSKVCTARGLRDRRVRLSAHTAIQFYDVQDRLGFDRPSKAVDWLLRNAQPAIHDLSPSTAAFPPPLPHPTPPLPPAAAAPTPDDLAIALLHHHHHHHHSLDADAVKAFFPIGISAPPPPPPPCSNSDIYQNNYQTARDHNNLHLSLHSSQAPNFHGGGGDYVLDFARRDSLQSSDLPSIRAACWFGPGPAHEPPEDAFAGFRVPTRIPGDGGFREKLASDAHQ